MTHRFAPLFSPPRLWVAGPLFTATARNPCTDKRLPRLRLAAKASALGSDVGISSVGDRSRAFAARLAGALRSFPFCRATCVERKAVGVWRSAQRFAFDFVRLVSCRVTCAVSDRRSYISKSVGARRPVFCVPSVWLSTVCLYFLFSFFCLAIACGEEIRDSRPLNRIPDLKHRISSTGSLKDSAHHPAPMAQSTATTPRYGSGSLSVPVPAPGKEPSPMPDPDLPTPAQSPPKPLCTYGSEPHSATMSSTLHSCQ